MGDPEHFVYSSRHGYLPPVTQKDAVEIGKILRRLGYSKDKHQLRNGKKQKRRRRADASGASTSASGPEAGQTPTGGSEVSDPPQVYSSFL